MEHSIPDGELPAGLTYLRLLAQQLVTSTPEPENRLTVVTVPSARLGAVFASLGAALAEVSCHECNHRDLAQGVRIAGWRAGSFVDSVLNQVDTDEMCYAGITLHGHRESVHRLPDGFPERADRRLSFEYRARAAEAFGCSPTVIGQMLSTHAAHPVVVVGAPQAFGRDVSALDQQCPTRQLRVRLDVGATLSDWFRHPVLSTSAVPDPSESPWAIELRPRLVVINGSRAWRHSTLQIWPDVPVLVLLSRRSSADCQAASSIATAGRRPASVRSNEVMAYLKPRSGLEVASYLTPHAQEPEEDPW